MKIDFDGVQAFVTVAELGGFGKAARLLNLTQTALTRRIHPGHDSRVHNQEDTAWHINS